MNFANLRDEVQILLWWCACVSTVTIISIFMICQKHPYRNLLSPRAAL